MEEEINQNQIELGKKSRVVKHVFLVCFLFVFIAIGAFFVYEYTKGTFKDPDSFRDFINSYGYYGPVLLTLFQCFKVIYAFIPGFIGCIVGASLFGPFLGFLCNFIGICCGSMIVFLMARKFGVSVLKLIFSEKKYNSCLKWMNKWHKSYPVFLWIAILLPISPDDFLCYFSGLTEMKFKKFAIIILTAKPWVILAYSLIFGNLFE